MSNTVLDFTKVIKAMGHHIKSGSIHHQCLFETFPITSENSLLVMVSDSRWLEKPNYYALVSLDPNTGKPVITKTNDPDNFEITDIMIQNNRWVYSYLDILFHK